MYNKFTLIGLAGIGKSTTAKECMNILRSKGLICEIKSTDEIIKARFKNDDPVIIKFQKIKDINIPAAVFTAKSSTTAFTQEFGEEPLYRDLEEMFVRDIITSASNTDWFDLGGKAPLRADVGNILQEKHVIPIFLYAEHEIMLARLAMNDNWKKRGNYLVTGEDGWRDLAWKHREERLAKYTKLAPIAIAVENQTPLELAHEIMYRVVEFKHACFERRNAFTNKVRAFLKP